MARKQVDMKALNGRVVTSGREFDAVMKQLIQAAGQEAEARGRSIMLDMYGELVRKAPKDTGRTAAGFNISEMPSEWTPPEGEYATGKKGKRTIKGSVTEEQARAFHALPSGRAITVSNNVEYLIALEAGHSKQAEFGFLAEAIQWAKRRLEVAALTFSKERI